MKIDPVTLEVFRNRLDAIAQEMQNTLLKSAYSIMLKEGGDCSCALFSAAGETIAQAVSNPIHLAAFLPAAQHVLARFPAATMREGDVFVLNDPYNGGTHVPDVIVMVPVFAEGVLIAIGCSLGHHQDMGGMAPGSMPANATELLQEGFVIPPTRLYAQGVLNETLVEILRRNVRVPDMVYGDLMAQVAAGKTAALRLGHLIDRHGLELFAAVVPALLDHAERLTRAELARIPPGTYTFEDIIDSDGIDLDRQLRIAVTVTVSAAGMHVDFAGTSPQAKGPANCPPGAVLAPVYYAVHALLGAAIPGNSGAFRPITVSVPERSILSPVAPAPVGIRYHTLKRVVDALMGALSPVLPRRVPAAPHGSDLCMSWGGLDADTGRAFVYMECTTGGTGATWHSDGVDHMACDIGNSRNIPAEAAEIDFPVRIWANRLRIDSGGAGEFRGGLGVERVVELRRGEVTVSHRSDRHFTPPWGLGGGWPGARWTTLVERADGSRDTVPGRLIFRLSAGERVVGLTGGGGGHGDPLDRPPSAVFDDVSDGKVSVQAARKLYGVVIGADARLDAAATASLRATMARRGPAIDRGMRGWALEITNGESDDRGAIASGVTLSAPTSSRKAAP
ncbi:hydantoinase B/oxoprolinase family protein [Limobrevibacterium gyesilva]|uniref:Hydantoinase B/oxoprolinase family protein n=1 Tax=Limobrevibacterium gyesilva TaxID=2991712 RepID=A0AA41YQY6_9PROT|nr:hydantoinase B/oxoprolinase family protein [Limobrevibacterium gyesilva]MCW3477101.1 hydantoinase B/oxoprolinase family protein [Limobrevibacterium gyesilva]